MLKRKYLWWDQLSKDEILEDVKQCDIAILPIGAIEQHGPHCPCGSDAYNAKGLAERIAEKTGAMLLPLVQYGAHPYHHWYMPGNLPLSYETHIGVLCDIIRAASFTGYKKFFILSAHGQLSTTMVAVHKLGLEGFFTLSCHWYDLLRDNQTVLSTPMVHADEAETSLALYMYPEYVDMSKAVDDGGEPLVSREFISLPGMSPKPGQMFYFEGTMARPEYKELETGVIGWATRATTEKGEKIVTTAVDYISNIIEDIKERYPVGVVPPVK